MDPGDILIDLPECAEYHPASDLRSKSGWYPNINPEQYACTSRLRDMLEEKNLMDLFHRSDPDEIEFMKLLRFLRARKWDVKNALDMIVADLEWRQEDDRLGLRWDSVSDVLEGVDMLKLYKFYPTWIQSHDKQFRPVSYRQFGRFEVWNVLELTTMERIMKFHVWEMEQILRCMHENSRQCGYNIETFVVVVDVQGWSLKLTTGDAMALARGMASTDSDHYPERLGTMLLINAPSVLSFAWRVIQTFLDDVQKAKIRIMGTDPKEWQPVLFDLIDRENVPEMYGGFAQNPTPETAFASMNPPKNSAAALRRKKTKSKSAAGSVSSKKSSSGSARAGALDGGMVLGEETKQAKDEKQKSKPLPWYHNICQVPLCKDGDDDFDFIVHFNSVPGDRRPVIEPAASMRSCEIATQTDDTYFADVPAGSVPRTGASCQGQCSVM